MLDIMDKGLRKEILSRRRPANPIRCELVFPS